MNQSGSGYRNSIAASTHTAKKGLDLHLKQIGFKKVSNELTNEHYKLTFSKKSGPAENPLLIDVVEDEFCKVLETTISKIRRTYPQSAFFLRIVLDKRRNFSDGGVWLMSDPIREIIRAETKEIAI